MAKNRVRIMIHNGREKVVHRALADLMIRRGKAIEVKPPAKVTPEPPKKSTPKKSEPATRRTPEKPAAKQVEAETADEKSTKRTYRRRDLQAEE